MAKAIKGDKFMKVLFLGPYRDFTGWGYAAQDYILAMDAAGIDVVPRPIKLNNVNEKLPERILELEGKDSHGCDIVIQHILPHMMDYNGRFKKNIGLFASETSNFKKSRWADYLNQMDEVWVICEQQVWASQDSGVTKPINIVPHACNIDKYQQNYDKLELPCPKDHFIFYFIGEATRRKNLRALVTAFHLEFHKDEPVELLLKVSRPGMSDLECERETGNFCNEIKNGLKLYPDYRFYKKELILSQRLPEKTIMQLHHTCDCFVMPSYGEAWCIPAFDAMAIGKTPICSAVGGMVDFLENKKESGGWLVRTNTEPVFGAVDTLPFLFAGEETWESIDIPMLRQTMREAFENHELRKEKSETGMGMAYNYSYGAIGEKIKELLAQ